MKILFISILAVMLLVAGAYFAYTKSVVKKPVSCQSLSPRPVIVAFGDSLVVGYGAPEGEGFVDDLSTSIRTPILNAGIVGNTTADGLTRIQEVLDQKPDIVLLLLGGNDALRKIPLAQTSANLDSILKTLSDKKITIVLLAPPGGLLSDPYAPLYKALAKKYSTELVPNVLGRLIGHSEFMTDTVHPNSVGYKKLAEKVLSALTSACNTYATTVGGR